MRDELFEIEPDKLRSKLRFLETRAEYHLEFRRKKYEHNAIAATTLRDAASIALLLGEAKIAKKHLHDAGRSFLELGLVYGAALVSLANYGDAGLVLEECKDLISAVRLQAPAESLDQKGTARPLERTARTLPNQMFALFQFDCLKNRKALFDSEVDPYRKALGRSAGYQVGATGISIETYVKMGQFLTRAEDKLFTDSPKFIDQSIQAIASARKEAIRAAVKDCYHWRLVPRPSELVDFDTVILCSLANQTDFQLDPFERFLDDDAPYFSAPYRAAQLLKD